MERIRLKLRTKPNPIWRLIMKIPGSASYIMLPIYKTGPFSSEVDGLEALNGLQIQNWTVLK